MSLANKPVFLLYSNCIPVKGARRSIICDLQRERAQFIPNALYEILSRFRGVATDEIKKAFDHASDGLIDEYFSFLETRGFGFWTEEPEAFPLLDLTWDEPGRVTNAIVDIDETSRHDFRDLFKQLEQMGCHAVQVRAYCTLTVDQIRDIAKSAELLAFRHIEIMVRYNDKLSPVELIALCHRWQVINRMTVHSSPASERIRATPFANVIDFVQAPISPSSCGQVHDSYFSVTLAHFSESQHHNSCLNRKISICANGDIKTCPALPSSCGNSSDTPLVNILKHADFIRLGQIDKDQIEICKDCEFRYICTDCRAYRQGPDMLSKPAKCGYDPYTATWHAVSSEGVVV